MTIDFDWAQVQSTQVIRVTAKTTITKISDATIIFALPRIFRTRKLDKAIELDAGTYLLVLMKNGFIGIYGTGSTETDWTLLYTRELLPSSSLTGS